MVSELFKNDETYSPTPVPISWTALTYLFASLTICGLLYLATASTSRKETVNGIITSRQGEIKLVAPKGGILTNVYVSEGENVTKGQALVEVSTEQSSRTDSINLQILHVIDSQIEALQTQLSAFDQSTSIELDRLKRHIGNERAQLRLLDDSLPAQIQKKDAAQSTVKSGEYLFSEGALSQLQLQTFQFAYLDAEQAISDAKLKISQLQDVIASDEYVLANFPNNRIQARASIVESIGVLKEKRTAAVAESGYTLRANISGRISSMQAKIGQTVNSTGPLLTILPHGSALYAQVYIPSRAIGFVRVGQKVRVMYDAFPYQKFGAAEGVVHQVSSTVLKPNEIATAVRMTEPAYPVEIDLTKDAINTFGQRVPLATGMALKADVILEKETFLNIILQPVIAAKTRM